MNLTDKLYAYNVAKGNNTNDKSIFSVAAPRTFMCGIEYKFDLRK